MSSSSCLASGASASGSVDGWQIKGGKEMSSIKDQIRQEIERRKKVYLTKNGFPRGTFGAIKIETYEGLLDFIDSLHEEQLTWQDIKKIVNIADAMLDDPKMRIAIANHSEEEYYKMILKEFNNVED